MKWISSVTARTLDSWSKDRGFNIRSGRYQLVTAWVTVFGHDFVLGQVG